MTAEFEGCFSNGGRRGDCYLGVFVASQERLVAPNLGGNQGL